MPYGHNALLAMLMVLFSTSNVPLPFKGHPMEQGKITKLKLKQLSPTHNFQAFTPAWTNRSLHNHVISSWQSQPESTHNQ